MEVVSTACAVPHWLSPAHWWASCSVSCCVRCRERCTFTAWLCNKATREGSLLHWWHLQPCSQWHDTWPAKDVMWNEDVCSSLMLVGWFALRWWIDCFSILLWLLITLRLQAGHCRHLLQLLFKAGLPGCCGSLTLLSPLHLELPLFVQYTKCGHSVSLHAGQES